MRHRAGRYGADGPVRQGSLREHNLALVLRHVAASPRPLSRASVAGATGLTRATVSALVDDLISARLLTEVEPAPRAGAGRPAHGLTLACDGPSGLGLEVNVDYLAACVVDLTGTVRQRLIQPGDQRPRPPREVFADLTRLAAKARDAAHDCGLALAGAALAVPGLVDADGLIRLAPNLGWRDVPVPRSVAALDPAGPALPLRVDNEANLAALGELHAGPAGRQSFVYVSGEIGIGAGIVLDGALFRGARGWSGELGHVTVDPDGPECHCGSRGCLEPYAGQEALLGAASPAGGPDGDGTTGAERDGTTGAERDGTTGAERDAGRLAELAAEGDPTALRALTAAGTALGVALAGVVNLLDVDTVVLGGVYAPLTPWLGPVVQRELRARVLTAQWSPVTVRPSLLGGSAAVVGAAGSVVRAVRDQPAAWLARPTATGAAAPPA